MDQGLKRRTTVNILQRSFSVPEIERHAQKAVGRAYRTRYSGKQCRTLPEVPSFRSYQVALVLHPRLLGRALRVFWQPAMLYAWRVAALSAAALFM